MRLESSPQSRVAIELRATGLLQAVGHDPTLTARPEPFAIDVGEGEPVDAPVEARFAASAIEAPEALPPADRAKMLDNMRGPDVLDAKRHPQIDFRGRYTGTLQGGALSGNLWLRGVPRPMHVEVRVERRGEGLIVQGVWQGRLTELGIKPFRALLGALRLDDWIRLRLDISFPHH